MFIHRELHHLSLIIREYQTKIAQIHLILHYFINFLSFLSTYIIPQKFFYGKLTALVLPLVYICAVSRLPPLLWPCLFNTSPSRNSSRSVTAYPPHRAGGGDGIGITAPCAASGGFIWAFSLLHGKDGGHGRKRCMRRL